MQTLDEFNLKHFLCVKRYRSIFKILRSYLSVMFLCTKVCTLYEMTIYEKSFDSVEISKTVLKYALIQKTNFEIPYVKMKQFNKSHYSLYLGLFSDMGYVVDNQNSGQNNLSNQLQWGNGISIDYVTYYDKLLRIEFSINHLGEKGVFLHFSNPFGSKDKL